MRSILRLTIVITIAFCVFGAYASISNFFHARSSASWPSENGVIIDSDIIEIRNAGDVVTAGVVEYEAYVKYRFKVDNHEFTNSTLSFPNPAHFPDKKSAVQFLRKYPIQSRVVVYYSPDDPAESCLERRRGSNSFVIGSSLMFATIIALCIFGLTLIPASENGHD